MRVDRSGLSVDPNSLYPHSLIPPKSGGSNNSSATCSPSVPLIAPQLAFSPWSLVGKQNLGGGITICLYKHFLTNEHDQIMGGDDGYCPPSKLG